jgi:hypothetical protein
MVDLAGLTVLAYFVGLVDCRTHFLFFERRTPSVALCPSYDRFEAYLSQFWP